MKSVRTAVLDEVYQTFLAQIGETYPMGEDPTKDDQFINAMVTKVKRIEGGVEVTLTVENHPVVVVLTPNRSVQ